MTIDTAEEYVESAAASQLLSVSQHQLSRIKDRGCRHTTDSDRRVMRAPNYKALGHPGLSNATREIDLDVNDMTTGISTGADFTQPFSDKEGESSRHRPGFEMAGEGSLHSMQAVTFNKTHRDIADDILGRRSPQVFPEETAGPPPHYYGAAAAPLRSGEVENKDFTQRCIQACRGALYDLMYWEEIDPDDKQAGVISYITRGNRGGYLLFVLVLIAIGVFLVYRLFF